MERGVFRPAGPSDLRTPCPFVNALANHGYIPRDGHNASAQDVAAGCRAVGISSLLATVFSIPIRFVGGGIRRPGQVDKDGRPCIDINQISKPGRLEHDVSLTRRDAAQGDNCTLQPDLVEDLINCGDGKRITLDDLVALRKRRIEMQEHDNPKVTYTKREHFFACGEMALILRMFGDGQSVPVDRVRAFFKDERFPYQEGWKPRSWWNSFGLFELLYRSWQIVKLFTIDFTKGKTS